jgi:MoxR-like ATPase
MIKELANQINQVLIGKEEIVKNVLVCLLSGGHVLLEDVPGVGKTTLAKALAKSIDSSFGRIQFTPDTLPGDILGMNIYNSKKQEFEYKPGIISNQLILADEINRTSPKTQSALLEAMAEGQTTIDGKIYTLPDPFMVIATQNPIEFMGTYPLPEAQLDRFMMKLSIGYPNEESEIKMAENFTKGNSLEEIKPVCTTKDIIKAKKDVEKIHISKELIAYARSIIDLTRTEEKISLGASPRALLNLIRASQALAYINGRDFVKPDDIKEVAVYVLHHRVILSSEAKISRENVDELLTWLIGKADVPTDK